MSKCNKCAYQICLVSLTTFSEVVMGLSWYKNQCLPKWFTFVVPCKHACNIDQLLSFKPVNACHVNYTSVVPSIHKMIDYYDISNKCYCWQCHPFQQQIRQHIPVLSYLLLNWTMLSSCSLNSSMTYFILYNRLVTVSNRLQTKASSPQQLSSLNSHIITITITQAHN